MKKIIGIIVIILLISTALPAFGIINETIIRKDNTVNMQQIPGIYFYQINYYWEKSTYTNSNTGELVVNIEKLKKDTGLQSGFINVYSTRGWIIQNLPFFENSKYPQTSMFFDLGQTGECTSINVHIEVSGEPFSEFTYSGALKPYPVVATPYNAEGDEEPVSFPRPQPPPPNIPGENDFNKFGDTLVYTQNNHPNVPVAHMQCVPAAYANNLQYLENEFGTPVDDELKEGINGTSSLTGQLDIYMERKSEGWTKGNGTNYIKGLNGFLKYTYFESLPIIVRHQGLKGDEDFTYLDFTSKGQGKTISIDFIMDEMKEGHAVALLYWYYVSGEHKGGHMVQLTSAGKILGVPFIEFLHDPNQGDFDPDHTAGNTTQHSYLIDYDIDGKLNVVDVSWNSPSGPPEVELLVIMDVENRAPEKPLMPFGGNITMKTGVEYEFTTSTTDPNGHKIWYFFDWGDETNSGWIGPYDSGKPATAFHRWGEVGVYIIKAKARDYYNAESEWSDDRLGILPKVKSIDNTNLMLFRLIELFSILKYLI